MNESTAQANGQAPVERMTDRFAEEMLRPLVAREVAEQLAVPPRRWSFELILRELAWAVALFGAGMAVGGWLL